MFARCWSGRSSRRQRRSSPRKFTRMTNAPALPQLSFSLPSFSAEDPGGWGHLRDRARVADEAGIDRVVCSDHVVYGENLEAYSDPSVGGQAGGKQPTGPD